MIFRKCKWYNASTQTDGEISKIWESQYQQIIRKRSIVIQENERLVFYSVEEDSQYLRKMLIAS